MKHHSFIWHIAFFWFLPIVGSHGFSNIPEFYQKSKNGNTHLISTQKDSRTQELPEYMRIRNRIGAMMASGRCYYEFNQVKTDPILVHWKECVLLQLSGQRENLVRKKKILERERNDLWFIFVRKINELNAKIRVVEDILKHPITRLLAQIKQAPLEEAERLVVQIGKQWPYNLNSLGGRIASNVEEIQNCFKQVGFDGFGAAQFLLESRPDYKQKKSNEKQLESKQNNIKRLLDTQWADLDQAVMEYEEDETRCPCKHELLSQRITAYYETKMSPVYIQKNYSLTDCITQAIQLHGLEASSYQWLYGNQLQHAIHQECIALLERMIAISTDNVLHAYQDGLVDCLDAARDYNQSGLVLNAILISDFCWALVDCGNAMVEGAVSGAAGALWDCIEHPVLTIACVAAGKYVLAYQAAKAIFKLVELDIKYSRHPELIVPDWKEFSKSISQIIKALKEKQFFLHDFLKEATQFGAHLFIQHKLLGGLGKLYGTVQLKVIEFVRKNPWATPQHYMAMPEGSIVKALRDSGIAEFRSEIESLGQQIELANLTESAIEEGVKYVMINKLRHIFKKSKHNLQPLVDKLGGEESVTRAILKAANGKLPADGVFENIPVSVDGFTVYVRGRVMDGIPKIGTCFIK